MGCKKGIFCADVFLDGLLHIQFSLKLMSVLSHFYNIMLVAWAVRLNGAFVHFHHDVGEEGVWGREMCREGHSGEI